MVLQARGYVEDIWVIHGDTVSAGHSINIIQYLSIYHSFMFAFPIPIQDRCFPSAPLKRTAVPFSVPLSNSATQRHLEKVMPQEAIAITRITST